MSKLCNVCGCPCEDNNIYCPTCGSPLPESVPVAQPQTQSQTQQAQPQFQQAQPQFQQAQSQTQQAQPQQAQPQFQQAQAQVQQAQAQPQFQQVQPQFQQAQSQTQQAQPQQAQPQFQQTQQAQPQFQQVQPQFQQAQPQFQQAQPQQVQPQFQQVQQAQPQFQQAQPQFQQEPPKKKSRKTLFIILGIVGGLIIILIILVIILVLFLRNHLIANNIPGTFTGASSSYERYETDNHEYYFPDYDGADHNSESYISNPTEATTEATTEAASIAPEESVAAITEADLRILGQVTGETEGEILTEPIPMSIDYSYTLTSSSTCSMTLLGSGDSPTELNSESRYVQLSTGRDIVIGASANDLINKYGIDTTNAMWIMQNGETTDAYYYSTVSTPDFTAEQTQLVIGWYLTNDTWIRLSPSELNDVLCNYIYPDCSSIILYKATINSEYTIDAIQIDYGSIDAMPKME